MAELSELNVNNFSSFLKSTDPLGVSKILIEDEEGNIYSEAVLSYDYDRQAVIVTVAGEPEEPEGG
jgi:hypothetical protein